MIITTFVICSIAAVFLSGAALVTGHGVASFALLALGVGWLSIITATLRRAARTALHPPDKPTR